MSSNKPISQRFWEKVIKTDKCWEWKSIINAYGYGVFCIGPHNTNRRHMAHRIAYELTYGEFDKTLYVCHKCDNRKCVRPDHLFLGTQFDNMQDCSRKGRMPIRNAKEFSIKNPYGEIINVINLRKFCRDNNLNRQRINLVISGGCNHHKGWTKA